MKHSIFKRVSLFTLLIAMSAGISGCLGGDDESPGNSDPAAEKAVTKEKADDPVKSMPEEEADGDAVKTDDDADTSVEAESEKTDSEESENEATKKEVIEQPASENKEDKEAEAATEEKSEDAGDASNDMNAADEPAGEKWEVPTGNDPIGSDDDNNTDAMKSEDMNETTELPTDGDRWMVPTGADPISGEKAGEGESADMSDSDGKWSVPTGADPQY